MPGNLLCDIAYIFSYLMYRTIHIKILASQIRLLKYLHPLTVVYEHFMCWIVSFLHPRAVRDDDGSSSEEDDQSNKSKNSNSYDSIEHSSSLSEISETSDMDVSGLLDNEAEEGLLSSEVEESEVEESESEVSGESDKGFILHEAEDEEVYRARKKRRRAVIESDSGAGVEVGGVKATKRRAHFADSSSNDEDEMEDHMLKETKEELPPEDGGSESLSELESKSEVKVVPLFV